MIFKKIFISLLFAAYIVPAYSQNIDTNKLKAQATEMAESLMKEDYITLAKYTHPKVVEMMGGPENMAAIITNMLEEMKAKGFTFKAASVSLTPLKAKAGNQVHAIVTQTIVMGVPGGTVTSNSSLLAITDDNGEHWHFIDMAKLTDMDKIKAILPNYNPDLKIPAKQTPIFKKDQ